MKAKSMEFFDSHEQIKRIAKTGIKQSQAEAIVYALSISRNNDVANLATKDQLNLVEQELKSEIAAMGQALRAEIETLRQELKSDIKDIKLSIKDVKFDMIKWMLGMWTTTLLALVALYFK